jgi:uncharacterized RDD family membrane protein YckC
MCVFPMQNAVMPAIKVPTTFNIDVEFDVPEFYRRLLALLIDMVIEFSYVVIAGKVYEAIFRNYYGFDDDSQYNLGAIGLLFFLPVLVYHVALEILMNGQSVGKKIMGIRVVTENGGRPGISQLFIRWLLRISDLWIAMLIIFLAANPVFFMNRWDTFFVVLLAVGFLITDIVLVVSSKKGQRIGDMLAHTILIRSRSKADIEETVFQEVADSYIPSFPQIMQLSDKDINSIKSILQTARKKGDFHLAAVAADKIKHHLSINTSMSPFDFLDVVLKDYNYLSSK